MESTPLDAHFAGLASELFHRGMPWYRAYRRPGVRRRVARLNRARGLLAESRLFAPFNPVLRVYAGERLDGRFTDPRIHCDVCREVVAARVIHTDPVVVAREVVYAGRNHRITCPRALAIDRKDLA